MTLEISEDYRQKKKKIVDTDSGRGRQRRRLVGAEFEKFWELREGKDGVWGQVQGKCMHTQK